jgi:phosphoserine phosphatase RsbU/P
MDDDITREEAFDPELGAPDAVEVDSTATGASPDDPLAWLLDMSHQLPPAELGEALDTALGSLGATASRIYLVDHDQASLHPFGDGGNVDQSFPVDGTIGGRSFAFQTVITVPHGEGVRTWVPLIDGTARLGALSVDLPARLEGDDDRRLRRIASMGAELLVTKGQYTDEFEKIRRRKAMTLEAELQRITLPPVALVTPVVTVSGILLPAYEVAGDSFDYSLNEDTLEVAIIDSVGHVLESSVISHLVSGSLRNSRRNGVDLVEAYAAADAAVNRIFPEFMFATAAFGRLDLSSGRFRWISAGHPLPVVVRGGRVAGEAEAVPALPLGLGGAEPRVNEVVLEAGDALLLYTDGAVEGGASGRDRFGLDRLTDLLGQNLLADLPSAETLRRLVVAVLEHSAYELRDDTTMLLVEYRGQPDR